MNMVFQAGDVVRLKLAATPMTVQAIPSEGVVDVIWFDNSDLRQATFRADELQRVPESWQALN